MDVLFQACWLQMSPVDWLGINKTNIQLECTSCINAIVACVLINISIDGKQNPYWMSLFWQRQSPIILYSLKELSILFLPIVSIYDNLMSVIEWRISWNWVFNYLYTVVYVMSTMYFEINFIFHPICRETSEEKKLHKLKYFRSFFLTWFQYYSNKNLGQMDAEFYVRMLHFIGYKFR